MRLIDSDALKETIISNVYPVVDDFNNHDYGMFWTGGIEKAIDEQPTICGTIKNQKKVKLKHCPFCGSSEIMIDVDRRGLSEIYCCDCGASVTRFHKAEAINAWNYRRGEKEEG